MRKFILMTLALSMLLSFSGCKARDWIEKQREKIFPTEDAKTLSGREVTPMPNIINMGVCDFDTFNPLITKSRTVKEATEFIYEPLFAMDENMRAVGVLAKDFNVSPDGRIININIKDNIYWHDGDKLTALDAAYTIKSILNGKTNYSLNGIADYLAIDDYVLRIVLTSSVPKFETLLTFPIVKNGTDMKPSKNYIPNGTGPFCFGSKSSVDEIYFSAFDSYHGGRAKIDALYIHLLPSGAEYVTMLEASGIDFASGETVDLFEYMPKANLNIYNFSSNTLVFLGYNMNGKIFKGADTRKGISELIDKKDIVETAVFSHGIAVDVPINPSSYLYYTREAEGDKLNSDDYLAKDGWKPDANGHYVRDTDGEYLSLEILANSDSSSQLSVANNIAERINGFNIYAVVKALPYDEYAKRINSGNYDLFVGETAIGNNGDLSPLVSSSGNYFGYNNSSLDTIIAQIGMTRNEEEEKALFRQYCDIILNDMPFLPLYYKKGSVISTTNVKSGVTPSEDFLYRNSALWSTTE